MTILLLGITGRTGKELLDIALQRGYTIKALVRDKAKVRIAHERLQLVEGSPYEKETLRQAMQGCEAILSTVNISRNSDWPWSKLRTPENFLSTVAQHIIDLAPAAGIRRFIFMSAWGVGETRKDIPRWFRWMIEHSNIRYPYDDHERAENILQQSGILFTAVRAAALTNSSKKKQVRVSFNNSPKPSWLISRRDVAGFMMDVLEKERYVREKPVVSS